MATTDDPEEEMIREKMWVSRPTGTHLSQSRKAPGENSPLTRSDADPTKVGQVTLSHITEDEDDNVQIVFVETGPTRKSAAQEAAEQVIHEVTGAVVEYLLNKAEFQVKRFIAEKARPALKSRWENRRRLRKKQQSPSSSAPMSVREIRGAISEEVEEATVEYRESMSSSEAQARLMLALILKALSDAQLDLLADADIDLESAFDELERRFKGLPYEQVIFMIESLSTDQSLIASQLRDFERLLGLPAREGEQPVIEDQLDT